MQLTLPLIPPPILPLILLHRASATSDAFDSETIAPNIAAGRYSSFPKYPAVADESFDLKLPVPSLSAKFRSIALAAPEYLAACPNYLAMT